MNILILKPSSLGDVIHALPLLRLLKLHQPEARIYWWLARELVPLLEGDPDLAEIIPFDRRLWSSPRQWPALLVDLARLRRLRFDWVIDLQGLARSGAFAWLANGAFTLGIDTGREGASGFYDVAVPRPSQNAHAVDWYLEILRRLKVPVDEQYTWLPPRPAAALELRRKWPVDSARWMTICPGARWDSKRWPVGHFAALLRQLATEQPQLHFAIIGGTSDRELGAVLARAEADRVLDLTGQTTLPEMIEWIRASELMVTNDTGPMHVAAALRKPVVALFGPTDPRRTGPYGQTETVLRLPLPCAPCLKGQCQFEKPLECLRAISPGRVAEEISRRLTSTAAVALPAGAILR